MKTIKELVDTLNSVEPCKGFISMEFEDVSSKRKRRIHLRLEEFEESFPIHNRENFDLECDYLSVIVGKVEIFSLKYKEQNV